MKISKDAQKELKRIDESFSQLEKLTRLSGIDLDEYVLSFNFPDVSRIQREEVFIQNRSRQQVFELSQGKGSKSSNQKTSVKR